MAGTNFYVEVQPGLQVALTNADGLVTLATCQGTPPTDSGLFAPGALITQTDATPGNTSLFQNTGSAGSPSWSDVGNVSPGEIALADGQLLVGNALNVAQARAMSGDITIANDGLTTISSGAVTSTKLAANAVDASALDDGSVLNAKLGATIQGALKMGTSGSVVTDLSPGTSGQVLTAHGVGADLTWENNVPADGSITNAKLATMTQGTVKAGGAAGAVTDVGPGLEGQVLTGHGAGATPTWEYPNPEGTIPVYNNTGSTLTAGTLVYLKGFDTGSGNLTVDRADNTQRLATHVVATDILNATSGDVATAATVGSLNTSGAGLVGQAVYLSTSGGFTLSAPTLPYENAQQVGTVKTISMAAGEIDFFPSSAELVTVGRYMLQSDIISAGQIQNYNVTRVKLETPLQGAVAAYALQSTGGDFAPGTLVSVTNVSGGVLQVTKADASAGQTATHVCVNTLYNNVAGEIYPVSEVAGLDTSLLAVGTLLYLDPTTAGGYTSTEPSTAGNIAQEVGIVKTQSVTGYIEFYPGRMVIKRIARSNIQDQAIDTSKMADNVVTPPKMSLTVAAYLGNPDLAADDAIVAETDLVNSTYTIAGQPDCPRNVTVTITDTTPSIVSGNIAIVGTGADGAINVTDNIDISSGAGVYEGTKIFSYITSITGSGITVIGGAGDELIKVGTGSRIGLPSNIQNNAAIKTVFLGGAIPATASYYNGVNTSAVKNTDGGNPYDGMKPMIVTYNVGL